MPEPSQDPRWHLSTDEIAARARLKRAPVTSKPRELVSSQDVTAPLDPLVFSSPVVLSNGALFLPNHDLIQNHVGHWIKHPDKGSAFDKKTKYSPLAAKKSSLCLDASDEIRRAYFLSAWRSCRSRVFSATW